MTPEQFLQLCENVYHADKTGGAGEAKIFFRSVYIGANIPGMSPPTNDDTAVEGYELGRELKRKV